MKSAPVERFEWLPLGKYIDPLCRRVKPVEAWLDDSH